MKLSERSALRRFIGSENFICDHQHQRCDLFVET